jgi:ribosomal protein L7Ae-like RNA K-turn-binding protein
MQLGIRRARMKKRTGRPDAFRILGLARRAGAVAPGTDATRRSIRQGEARLILMAGDASSVQLDKIRRTMQDRSIPQAILGDRSTLGAAIGKAPVAAVAVTDESFAGLLLRSIGGEAAHEAEE